MSNCPLHTHIICAINLQANELNLTPTAKYINLLYTFEMPTKFFGGGLRWATEFDIDDENEKKKTEKSILQTISGDVIVPKFEWFAILKCVRDGPKRNQYDEALLCGVYKFFNAPMFLNLKM